MRFREIIIATVTYGRYQHTLWVKFRDSECTERGGGETGLRFTARGPLVARQSNLPTPETAVTVATEMLVINSD